MNKVPMPNTHHPSLERVAETIRSSSDALHVIQIPIVRPVVATWRPADDDSAPIDAAFPILTLVKKKCVGGAPYVGRPFVYWWWAWVADDGTNRAITSDTEIAYIGNPWRAA